MIENGFFILIGLLSGMISGMTGASGVMILIPVLTSFFGFSLFAAVGTSLMADIISSPFIALAYHQNKHLDIKSALWLIIGAIIGAQVGVEGTHIFPDAWILVAFSIFLLGLGIKFWHDGQMRRYSERSEAKAPWLTSPSQRIIAGLVLGFFLGMMTGIFGAGGGILYFLVLHFILRLDLKTSIGTAAFAMIASSVSAAWGHWQMGNLNIETGIVLGVAAAVGGVVAGYAANHVSEAALSKIVGGIFIILAVVMVVMRFVGS
ncbi:sulfite exporter TauE/SafE family protein [Candidatus Nomurabacteria bacterium]|nr:sulfite exporter TauE/SafE family protein [Candidatus Nomurabacteria bacterium]